MSAARDAWVDSTVSVLKHGNRFIKRHTDRARADVVATRVLFRRTLLLTGERAAALFYDHSRFQRAGAAPALLTATLFGEGGVQGLDGEAHRLRKQMFLDLLGSREVEALAERSRVEWRSAIPRWRDQGQVVVLDAARELLFRSVTTWADVPVDENELADRAAQMGDLIEGPGTLGWRHWRSRLSRRTAERWAADLILQTRAGTVRAAEGTALRSIAQHREDGHLLPERVAAVELLNVLRPVVAVARFITFMALALHSYPDTRERLRSGEIQPAWFVHEVRRYYPFFPFVAARAKEDFRWADALFKRGDRALLDLYGSNHDPRLWAHPEQFDPLRFRNWHEGPHRLIPQGGGDARTGHRCPGEPATVELMLVALDFLLNEVSYEVPPQDLRVNLRRMPARPESGFIIANVRAR